MNKHIINRIIEYFNDNTDVFNKCVEELDDYTAFLDEGPYYNMDEFDDICYGMTPTQIVDSVYRGFDVDFCAVFNPDRAYFRLNSLGNFISSDEKDYSDCLNESTIVKMCQHRTDIPTIYDYDELLELFNELDT